MEKYDLGILSAQLNSRAHMRIILPERQRVGDHFLNKRHLQKLCDGFCAGTGQDQPERTVSKLFL